MNEILSFAKLDYITIKCYLTFKNLVMFLLIFTFMGYFTGEVAAPIGMMMMYSTIYASYPFAVGDTNGIDTLYATLPITRKNIVIGRYVFALCLNVIVGIIGFVISGFLMVLLGKGYNWKETAIVLLFCFAAFSILEFVQLPIYFKLGYAKAKFLVYLPLVGFPVVVMAV